MVIPGFKIIRRHEAGVILAFQVGIHYHHGDSRPDGVGHRHPKRRIVQWRQYDAGYAAGHKILDHLDLAFAVVLLKRAFPDDLRPRLFTGLHRAGVDGFPEFMGCSFGDYGDRDAVGGSFAAGLLLLFAGRERGQSRQNRNKPHCSHRHTPVSCVRFVSLYYSGPAGKIKPQNSTLVYMCFSVAPTGFLP